MGHEGSTLSVMLESLGYPEDHPQTLRALVEADPDRISHPVAWALRSQAIEVRRSTELHYVNSPKDAFKLLRNNYVLHPWTGKWTMVALSSDRQVVYVPHPRGGTSPLRVNSPLVPKADALPSLPAERPGAARRPAWLVIYGGTPEVLSKPGVAKAVANLRRRTSVADVLFFSRDAQSGEPPTLWSLVAGVGNAETGSIGGRAVPFPDADALDEARRSS